MSHQRFSNPIIPGFYSDPSMIRVGDDFYMVHSSFEYFPSIPIWHSKDLVHWQQIGHVITRADQGLDLRDVSPSGGVQAATIRYHEGVFFVTSTRVKKEWPRLDYHFVVTTKDPRGPWSDCHFIDDAPGIDSSLFFDDDGQCYFLANREKADAKHGGDTDLWISKFDHHSMKLVGDKVSLWDGTGGYYPEGPRLFKHQNTYFLVIAEGGTLHNHTVTIASSSNVMGPYESLPNNPILSHKELDKTYPIQNIGHADMVELQDGSWWGVCLGSRPRGGFYTGGNTIYSFGGYYRNLGRETYLFPITWKANPLRPEFSPATNKIELEYELPNLKTHLLIDQPLSFSAESLALKWVSIRNEQRDYFEGKADQLTLELQPSMEESFLGFRQTDWSFDFQVELDISHLNENDDVFVVAYIKEGHYIGVRLLSSLIEILDATQTVIASTESVNKNHLIKLEARDQDYTFIVNDQLRATIDGRPISCDMTDSHTGVMIALSGSSTSKTKVIWSKVSYQGYDKS